MAARPLLTLVRIDNEYNALQEQVKLRLVVYWSAARKKRRRCASLFLSYEYVLVRDSVFLEFLFVLFSDATNDLDLSFLLGEEILFLFFFLLLKPLWDYLSNHLLWI
jgi:hypothetical protein